jgi:hypothetical protein
MDNPVNSLTSRWLIYKEEAEELNIESFCFMYLDTMYVSYKINSIWEYPTQITQLINAVSKTCSVYNRNSNDGYEIRISKISHLIGETVNITASQNEIVFTRASSVTNKKSYLLRQTSLNKEYVYLNIKYNLTAGSYKLEQEDSDTIILTLID